MQEHLSIRVYGTVRGVFFRSAAARRARALGLTGLARNEHDGSVTIEAEGTRSALEEFAAWCRSGPPHARVTHVECSFSKPSGRFKSFSIE